MRERESGTTGGQTGYHTLFPGPALKIVKKKQSDH